MEVATTDGAAVVGAQEPFSARTLSQSADGHPTSATVCEWASVVLPRKERDADHTRHGGAPAAPAVSAARHRDHNGPACSPPLQAVQSRHVQRQMAGTETGSDCSGDRAASGVQAVLWATCDRLGAWGCAGLTSGHTACEGRGGAAVAWAAVLAGLRLWFLTLSS